MREKKILLQIPPRHNLFTNRRPCHFILFFTLSFSLSHLSPIHLPLSPPLASPSPSTLHLPYMGFSIICLFISLTSSSPMGFSLTSSPPQLIAPSISYLNSPLPTAPTISDATLEIFFTPYASMVVCV